MAADPLGVPHGPPYTPGADADFERFRSLVLAGDKSWSLKYEDGPLKVWTKKYGSTSVLMGKISTVIDAEPAVVYDVLHDPDYRAVWDKHMIEGYDILGLDHNNDVGYYACKIGFGIADRDFLNQRSWRVQDNEWIIINHSVLHPDYPKRSGRVRAWSHLTGYFARPHAGGGTDFTYLTQTDPKGWIPTMLVNTAISYSAPSFASTFSKAVAGYPSWKNDHNPDYKPWLS